MKRKEKKIQSGQNASSFSLRRIILSTNKNSSHFLLTNTFLCRGVFYEVVLFSYLSQRYRFRIERVAYVWCCLEHCSLKMYEEACQSVQLQYKIC